MGKVTISAWVDEDLVAWARANGVDIQEIFVDELKTLISQASDANPLPLAGMTYSAIAQQALVKAKAEAIAPQF